MNAPWLFAEAYKYRRLHEAFSVSKYWGDYDVFYRQKVRSCRSVQFSSHLSPFSSSVILSRVLLTLYSSCLCVSSSLSHSRQAFLLKRGLKLSVSCSLNSLKVFHSSLPQPNFALLTLTSVCLWGNSTDLSLLINMTEEQIKSLQSTGGEHLASTEKNILGNDLNKLWDTVKELRGKTGGRVDFVLDNAGFELYCDCVYGMLFPHTFAIIEINSMFSSADFLIQSGLATQVRFHGKRYPWFVSDVTKKDWEWLLNTMVYGHLFPKASEAERESLRRLGNRWKVIHCLHQ